MNGAGLWESKATWTPKVCKTKAFRAVVMGLGFLFCIFGGFR